MLIVRRARPPAHGLYTLPGGEILLNEELAEAHWRLPDEIAGLQTTEGLAAIVAAAGERLGRSG